MAQDNKRFRPYYEPVPKGVSNWVFWKWFDELPREERDRINSASDGPEFVWLAARAMKLYPPKLQGTDDHETL